MARFTFLDDSAWNSYSDLAGGTILSRSSTALTYLSANGFTVTLQGTAFSYDAAGIPVSGMITRLDVYLDSAHLAEYTGLHTNLNVYARLGLGQVSGSTTETPPDMTALYERMRSINDIITGSDFGRNYDGFNGNDTFYGGAGDDWFFGGTGYDDVFGGAGRDGASFLNGTRNEGIDVNYSQFHTMTVNRDGNGATDELYSIELLECTDFDDTVNLPWIGIFGPPGFTIWLMAGDDSVSTGYGNSTLYGGAGNDSVYGGDVADGGEGVDTIERVNNIAFWSADEGGHGAIVDLTLTTGHILDDGFGNVESADSTTSFFGTRFGDRFTGTGGAFWGNGGRDSLFGGEGNGSLYGGGGNDVVNAGAGDDQVSGGSGRDRINAGAGIDMLAFWDVDATGHGASVSLLRAKGQVLDDGYGNAETARGIDYLDGSAFADTFIGNTTGNALWGNAGDDTLTGVGGDDGLYGGDGRDRIYGGAGIDYVVGGTGLDMLTGGTEADYFHFMGPTPGSDGVDSITDFASDDGIVINVHWAADLALGNLTAAQFRIGFGATTATNAAQRVIYDMTTGDVYFDADGTGSAATVRIATLTNKAVLAYDQIFTTEPF